MGISADQHLILSRYSRDLFDALQPCGKAFAGEMMTWLVRSKALTNFDGELYVKILAPVPERILRQVIGEQIRSADTFIPVVGVIWSRCEKLMKDKQAELRAVQKLLAPRDPAPVEMSRDERMVSVERIRAKVATMFRAEA